MRRLTEADLIEMALDNRLTDINVALPGHVRAYDPDKQRADIELAVRRLVQNEEGDLVPEELPILPDVLVGWPMGGGFFLHCPLKPGDPVLVVFCDSNLSTWRRTGRISTPGDARQHHLANSWAIPGGRPDTSPLAGLHPDNAIFGRVGGPQVHITDSDIRAGAADANDRVATVKDLQAIYDAIQTAKTSPQDGGAFLQQTILQVLDGMGFPSGSPMLKTSADNYPEPVEPPDPPED